MSKGILWLQMACPRTVSTAADSTSSRFWKVFRINAELVLTFERLSRTRSPADTFDSSRLVPVDLYYALAEDTTRSRYSGLVRCPDAR